MSEKKELNLKKEKTLKQRYIYLAIAAVILFAIKLIPAPEGLEQSAMTLMAIMVTVVFLWVTEPIPHALSALLLPILISFLNVAKFNDVFALTFGSNVFAFLMGIIALSIACRKSGLSKRIANYFMLVINKNANVVFFGVMFLSFFVSMWITDMAAVGIIIPVAIGVLAAMGAAPLKSNYARALTLGVSWGSVFGGMTTPAGVGSNIMAMNLLEKAGITVSFTQWMAICFPIGFIGLIAGYFVLKLVFPFEIKEIPIDRALVREEMKKDKMSFSQKWVMIVFAVMIVGFLTSGSTKLNINLISFTVIPLLLLPGVNVFKGWKDFESSMNWGAIFLAVAGVSLGSLAQEVGLSGYIANVAFAPIAKMPNVAQLFAVATVTDIVGLFLSSMTITASVSIPIVIAFAQSTGASVLAMVIAATCASSTVIVLVTQTPALILSYAEGYYTLRDCAKAGIIMTVVSAVIVAGVVSVAMMLGVFA